MIFQIAKYDDFSDRLILGEKTGQCVNARRVRVDPEVALSGIFLNAMSSGYLSL